MGAHRDGRGTKAHGLALPRESALREPDKRREAAPGPAPTHAAVTMMNIARSRAARPADRTAQASAAHHPLCFVTMRASTSARAIGAFAFLIRGRFSVPASNAAITAS